MLAPANRRNPKHFTLQVFDRMVFGSNHKPVERPAQSHRHNPQWRTALERPNSAANRSLPNQLSGDAGRDRYCGIHLNELWLQSLYTVKALLLGQENVRVVDAAAGIGDPHLLQRLALSSDAFCVKEKVQRNREENDQDV